MASHNPVQIASRRELFVDDDLIDDKTDLASLRLHSPTPREVVLRTDRPWEGSMSTYITVFADEDRYRMYYTGWEIDLEQSARDHAIVEPHRMWACMAESPDALHWERPNLGLIEYKGSKANNIVWEGVGPKQFGVHGFAPFKDTNPQASPDARYKAIGAEWDPLKGDLYAMKSPDGIHWSLMQDEPILHQGKDGAFDSQNLAFWDGTLGQYRIYLRVIKDHQRLIATATSPDFLNWTSTELLTYPGSPDEQLYTNQVMPYPRAPHILVGFPSRYVQRSWSPAIEALPELEHRRLRSSVQERLGAALSDGLFMSSRDGKVFNRWDEAFIRPGPQLQNNWAYGDNYQCWGMIETPSALEGAPPELSFFARESVWRNGAIAIRRYSLRKDGFVSLNAPRRGAEVTTKPLLFEGDQLELNFATSAAGDIRVELQDAQGNPYPGFAMDDCHELIGDELDRVVRWTGGSDVRTLAGKPVRLRFAFNDADLYAFRFAPTA